MNLNAPAVNAFVNTVGLAVTAVGSIRTSPSFALGFSHIFLSIISSFIFLPFVAIPFSAPFLMLTLCLFESVFLLPFAFLISSPACPHS